MKDEKKLKLVIEYNNKSNKYDSEIDAENITGYDLLQVALSICRSCSETFEIDLDDFLDDIKMFDSFSVEDD